MATFVYTRPNNGTNLIYTVYTVCTVVVSVFHTHRSTSHRCGQVQLRSQLYGLSHTPTQSCGACNFFRASVRDGNPRRQHLHRMLIYNTARKPWNSLAKNNNIKLKPQPYILIQSDQPAVTITFLGGLWDNRFSASLYTCGKGRTAATKQLSNYWHPASPSRLPMEP